MKLELNVKRFNNEDVIATSACQYIGQSSYEYKTNDINHIQIVNSYVRFYTANQNGKLKKAEDTYFPFVTGDAFSNVIPETGKWYHYDTATSKFVECDDSCEHPIQSE